MKKINCTKKTSGEEMLREAENEEVVILQKGHAVALLVPFDDEDLEWYARERHPTFLSSIARARKQVQRGRTIGHAELTRQLGLD